MAAMCILILYPLYKTFFMSLYTELSARTLEFVGLQNFKEVLTFDYFNKTLLNTIIWTGGVVMFQILVGLSVAALINTKLRGTGLVSSLLLIPWVTPGVIAAIIWSWLYDPLYGVLNEILVFVGVLDKYKPWLADPRVSLWAIVAAGIWKGFPFSMIMFLAGMKAIPGELYEAAKVDGATPLACFRHITLPLLSPIFRITLLLLVIWTYNYFDLVYAMTGGGPNHATEILATLIYQLAFDHWRFGPASSLAVIMFAILAVFIAAYIWLLGRRRKEL
jgi:multiple sugar transport system permease protein